MDGMGMVDFFGTLGSRLKKMNTYFEFVLVAILYDQIVKFVQRNHEAISLKKLV